MVLLPDCLCCSNDAFLLCPSIIPAQQQSEHPFGWISYDIPESVTVDITFDHPGEVLVIENKKECCPYDPPFVTSALGLLITNPQSGTYSLLPTAVPWQYEYVSTTLFLRATLSRQVDRIDPPSVPAGQQLCGDYGELVIQFGRNARIYRADPFFTNAQVTEAELRAAVQAGSNQWLLPFSKTLTRYCRASVPDPAFTTKRCKTGQWDELWINPFNNGSRFPENTTVPVSFPVEVPGILDALDRPIRTLAQRQALDPCYYSTLGIPEWPCYDVANPDNGDPTYTYQGTTLINRVWQGPEQNSTCTVTINSIKAHTSGKPDKNVLDI